MHKCALSKNPPCTGEADTQSVNPTPSCVLWTESQKEEVPFCFPQGALNQLKLCSAEPPLTQRVHSQTWRHQQSRQSPGPKKAYLELGRTDSVGDTPSAAAAGPPLYSPEVTTWERVRVLLGGAAPQREHICRWGVNSRSYGNGQASSPEQPEAIKRHSHHSPQSVSSSCGAGWEGSQWP